MIFQFPLLETLFPINFHFCANIIGIEKFALSIFRNTKHGILKPIGRDFFKVASVALGFEVCTG